MFQNEMHNVVNSLQNRVRPNTLCITLNEKLGKYLSIYLSKKSRLWRRRCRSTTRAPNKNRPSPCDIVHSDWIAVLKCSFCVKLSHG